MKVTGTSCLVFFAVLYSSDAAITSWTLPSGGDASTTIRENAAANEAVVTILAVSDATIGDYTLLTSGVPFALATSGELTVASATLNFETTPTYTLSIQVVDDEPATATATLTVSVTNNNAPTFSSATFSTCAVDGSAAGTTVYTLSAADQDSGDTLTYTITGGNTDSDFAISTDKIVTANALAMATTASYDLVVEVSDTGETATATVTVSVSASCNSATALVFSLLTILTAFVVALN